MCTAGSTGSLSVIPGGGGSGRRHVYMYTRNGYRGPVTKCNTL